jgi:hypothetical protein
LHSHCDDGVPAAALLALCFPPSPPPPTRFTDVACGGSERALRLCEPREKSAPIQPASFGVCIVRGRVGGTHTSEAVRVRHCVDATRLQRLEIKRTCHKRRTLTRAMPSLLTTGACHPQSRPRDSDCGGELRATQGRRHSQTHSFRLRTVLCPARESTIKPHVPRSCCS